MPSVNHSGDVIRGHLLDALEHLLAALATSGVPPLSPPVEALDAALGADRGFQEARALLRDAVRALLAEVSSGEMKRCVLAV